MSASVKVPKRQCGESKMEYMARAGIDRTAADYARIEQAAAKRARRRSDALTARIVQHIEMEYVKEYSREVVTMWRPKGEFKAAR